jgi:hypothetical protein
MNQSKFLSKNISKIMTSCHMFYDARELWT